jgi:hypothetical protein
MPMTPKEILEIDARNNHPFGTKAGNLIAQINRTLMDGGDIVQEGNVLLLYVTKSPGVVEFHTFNADTPQNLAKAVQSLAVLLKKAGAKEMFTTYKNPKINELFKNYGSKFNIDITESDGVFTAKVSL